MDDARVLLVEELDAIGAAPGDARARVAALRAAGCNAALAVIEHGESPTAPASGCAEGAGRDAARFTADAAGRDALARWIASRRPERVLWAATAPDADVGPLVGEAELSWWPTGLPAVVGGLPSMLRHVPARGAHDPFDWSPVEPERLQRARLSLWDGPFVLAPMPLQGESGEALIEAFGTAVRGRDGFDLVVLSHTQPGFESLARRHGVALRTHFVGPSPREAEIAWLQHASAAVFAGRQPIACSLPLRADACGCPRLVAPGAVAGLAAWSEKAAGAWSTPATVDELAERLGEAMDGDPAARVQRERGRASVAAHTPSAVGERLARVLPRDAVRVPRRAA